MTDFELELSALEEQAPIELMNSLTRSGRFLKLCSTLLESVQDSMTDEELIMITAKLTALAAAMYIIGRKEATKELTMEIEALQNDIQEQGERD